ncbi:hypothetical protein BGX24_001740 [Mortierella sp. AD032]|nr:hypothetical protein BGX24_001740 [Mortierella sp. AD032]
MEVEFDSRPARPGSLIWSEDNILALVTPASVNIITPCLAGALDRSPTKFLLTSTPPLTVAGDGPPWKLGANVANIRNATSTLTIDYMAGAWSPTGCSLLKGQWQKYLVLDQYLSTYWGAQPEINLEMADKLESVSLAWSPKIHVGGIGSVLALGNKAGHITIWHITNKENVRCIESWKTGSDTWVTQLSWSPWVLEGDQYISMLAYATANGLVRVREVKFNSKSPLEGIEVTENVMGAPDQTLHPCTVLRWSPTSYETANKRNILAFSKGNRLNVWLPESNKTLLWRRPIAKAIADITWDTLGQRLVVFFMDGKHCVLFLEDDDLRVDDEQVEFVHQNIISRCHMQTKTNITQEEGDADNANADDDNAEDENSGGGAMGSKLQLHIISGSGSYERIQLATAYYDDKKSGRCDLEASLMKRFEHFVQNAETRVRKHITGSVLNLLNEVSATSEVPLQDYDRSLLLLLCDSVLLFHNQDKSLLATAEKTYLRLQSSCAVDEQLKVLQDIHKGTLQSRVSFKAGREECPACDAEVKLEDQLEATCANGHTWRRCSVTLLVIADFHPRTCLGCGRKTLMMPDAQADASTLPGTTATSWLEVVLRAHSLCGYCGERFYTALRRRT